MASHRSNCSEETKMPRSVIISIASLAFLVAGAPAQECDFPITDDDTLAAAARQFHGVMGPLWHGPLKEGDYDQLAERIGELVAGRDAVMNASLPPRHLHNCARFSANAALFSQATDNLAELVGAGAGNPELHAAFSDMHDRYREMMLVLRAPDDPVEAIHDVIRFLWHEAYPARDVEAIGELLPELKARAERLLISTPPEGADAEEFARLACELVASVVRLQLALDGDDADPVLEALSAVHDAFHAISGE